MNDIILNCEKSELSAAGEEYIVDFKASGQVRFGFDETIEYCLYDVGREVDLDALLCKVLEARMKRDVIPYCAFTRRTERQITDRLYNRFSADDGYAGVWAPVVKRAAENVVSYLKERGYAGDSAYCAAYIKSCAGKNSSGDYIAGELIRLGGDRSVAALAVAEASLDEAEACRRALVKKADNTRMIFDEDCRVAQKTRAALIRFLLSRGFETGLAVNTVDDYIDRIRN